MPPGRMRIPLAASFRPDPGAVVAGSNAGEEEGLERRKSRPPVGPEAEENRHMTGERAASVCQKTAACGN